MKEIIGKDRIEKVVIAPVDDNLKFIEGKEMIFDVDTLLLSVGLIPNNPLLLPIGVKMHPRTKGPIVNENLETSIKGIFACGNSLHVHDLVDFVSEEGMIAGLKASEYIKGMLNKEKDDKEIIIEAKDGIGYCLPATTTLNNLLDTTLKFRVTKPFNNVFIEIKLNGITIKKIKKLYLLPAEMENISLSSIDLSSYSELLKDNNLLLTVEVTK